jgi:DNA-binding Lrp family transcriptional regulator
MTTDTKIKILGYIKANGQARVKDLVDHLGIGNVAVHRQLKNLLKSGQLKKAGMSPKVYYLLPDLKQDANLDNFAYVDPVGNFLTGLPAFMVWAKNVNKENQIGSLLPRYISDRKQINDLFSKEGWIEATDNLSRTFGSDLQLNGVFYLDFYSLPTFGKTRLGHMMLYAKQSENKQLIAQVAQEARPVITKLLTKLKINAVGFIPHSILRKVQFLKEFSKNLNLNLPEIELNKAYSGAIRVAQKTLGRLEERISNARGTIFIDKSGPRCKNILLIDDATGSGATLNETARKLKEAGLAKKVYGFVVVGSIKGFEVIREV